MAPIDPNDILNAAQSASRNTLQEHCTVLVRAGIITLFSGLEEKASTIRQQRDALLSETDYMMMPDYPMSELARENLKVYRQLLRDISEQPGFPDEVVWPIRGE